jgi:hypothetical protein
MQRRPVTMRCAWRLLGLALLTLGIAACGSESLLRAGPPAAGASGVTGSMASPPGLTSPGDAAAGPFPAAATSAPPASDASGAPSRWSLTVYYTAVESYHAGPPQAVTGCPLGANGCSNGTTALGTYPGDFLQTVRDEGAGRITSGMFAGRYLIWDPDHGWSLDTAPRDAAGDPLRPFVSAATDESVALGIDFRVLDCGTDSETGAPIEAGTCARLRAARWEVDDRNGETGISHAIVLYIGEEDRPDVETSSPLMVDAVDARTTLR